MLNHLQINQKKIIPYRPFHRAIDENLKTLEDAGRFCIRNLPEYCSSALPAHSYKIVITTSTVGVQIDSVSVVRNLLSISVHLYGEFVARFCQPSRNVVEKGLNLFNDY